MKLTNLLTFPKILFILTILASQSLSLENKNRITLSAKVQSNLRAFSLVKNQTNSSNPTSYSSDSSSSATGAIKNETRILSAPFKVKSCDQVIEIEGFKTLTDMEDFNKKEDRFFTLSVYMVNEFKKKDSASLTESIAVGANGELPNIMAGSVGCVKFRNGMRKIIICLESEEKANNLIQAYKDFLKCRAGGNLQLVQESNINRILKQSCLGLDIKADPKMLDKNDPTGKKIELAITSALLNVSNKFRDINSVQSTVSAVSNEKISKTTIGQKQKI